jgi:uncharacterized membrane protein HdeD (DUF308 family)
MNNGTKTDLQVIQAERLGEVQDFTRFWWLNIVRGTAALLIGIGLLIPIELFLKADRLQGILFQFVGIYLLLSGVMSLIWGFSNRRRLGLWILAGLLGLVGGIAFFLRPTLEGYLSSTVLTIIFGSIMLLTGIIHVLGGFRLGESYGRRWTRGHMSLGLVEIVIGLVIFISIFVPVENLRIILSLWGLIAGVGLIAEGLGSRKRKNAQVG